MSVYFVPIAISVLGVATLTCLSFGPNAQSRQIAVLIPPWQVDGLSRATSTGLAIVDMHWQRHIVVLDIGGDSNALDRLRGKGLWLMDATGTTVCGNSENKDLT